jgi:hypothetical protein
LSVAECANHSMWLFVNSTYLANFLSCVCGSVERLAGLLFPLSVHSKIVALWLAV